MRVSSVAAWIAGVFVAMELVDGLACGQSVIGHVFSAKDTWLLAYMVVLVATMVVWRHPTYRFRVVAACAALSAALVPIVSYHGPDYIFGPGISIVGVGALVAMGVHLLVVALVVDGEAPPRGHLFLGVAALLTAVTVAHALTDELHTTACFEPHPDMAHLDGTTAFIDVDTGEVVMREPLPCSLRWKLRKLYGCAWGVETTPTR